MSDNVVYLKHIFSKSRNSVEDLCDYASQELEEVLIIGRDQDGYIKMITNQPDAAELIFYMESAKFSLLAGGLVDEDT